MKGINQLGFTIVELMISTAVFSVILLIITAGVLSFSRQYIKGQTGNRVQLAANAVVNQLSQDIQFSSGTVGSPSVPSNAPTTSTPTGCFVIGGNIYAYRVGGQLGSGHFAHALVVAPINNPDGTSNICDTSTTPEGLASVSKSRELLTQNSRLTALDITSNSAGVYSINLGLIYGDDDLLAPGIGGSNTWSEQHCKSNAGSEFCYQLQLTTQVSKRVQ